MIQNSNSFYYHPTIVPVSQKCSKCSQNIYETVAAFGTKWFYCQKCEIYLIWSHGTSLEKTKLPYTEIEMLLTMFLDNKTPKDAFDILNYKFVDKGLNINTTRRYFTIFCSIVLDFYHEQMSSLLLDGEVEIDESHLFREKKTSAPHRKYQLSSVWIFGAKQRNSPKFFLIPLKKREETILVPLIKKHIKQGSTIYTDSFAVYVNNYTKESKLQR